MRDKIRLTINGKEAPGLISFSFAADMFSPADDFEVRYRPDEYPEAAQKIELFVNGEKEFSGIVDEIEDKDSKDGGVEIYIRGPDFGGLLEKSFVEKFGEMGGKTIQAIADELLKDVPYLNRLEVKVEGKQKNAAKLSKPEVGDTILDYLSRVANSKGMIFSVEPEGTLLFAPVPTEKKEEFKILRAAGNPENNVLESSRSIKIGDLYSEVRIYGQDNGGNNFKATAKNPRAPFRKIFVGQFNEDEGSAKDQAASIVDSQIRESLALSYSVPGFSQGGKNWKIRKGVRVEDSRRKIKETLLIYGRTFTFDKEAGLKTSLNLGYFAEKR